MGLITSMLRSFFIRQELRLIMVGLYGVGKTSILYRIKHGKFSQSIIPTVGFNVEKFYYKNISVTIWDIGGGDKIRTFWQHYYHDSQGIIFIIDSTDRQSFIEAERYLADVLKQDLQFEAIILIIANKQDLANAMSVKELQNMLNPDLFGSRKWFIQPACAVTGQGLNEGLDWLLNKVAEKNRLTTSRNNNIRSVYIDV